MRHNDQFRPVGATRSQPVIAFERPQVRTIRRPGHAAAAGRLDWQLHIRQRRIEMADAQHRQLFGAGGDGEQDQEVRAYGHAASTPRASLP